MPQADVIVDRESLYDIALRTIRIEENALRTMADTFGSTDLGEAVVAAVETISATTGRVVVSGMGKSGLVGRKIAATFASTGTPSFFLHPGEASHGDLGMITRDDVVIALSWSGETTELVDVLHYCARFAIPLIAITSQPLSALGRQAQICLTLPRVSEACPNNLAPTSSTTMQATLGDVLAVAALERRRFTSADFKVLHPRGQLAARLLSVGDLMNEGDHLPVVAQTETIAGATLEMSAKRLGIAAVTDEEGLLVGAFSDGDLRRSLASGTLNDEVRRHMTLHPTIVDRSMLASEALALMNSRNISQLFICTDGQRLVGIVHLHDILRAGVA